MYLPVIDPADGRLRQMIMRAMQTHRFRLRKAAQSDLRWLAETLKRESAKLNTRVDLEQGKLRVAGQAV
jgi:poly-gamma-glutamate capsule biosynthesis protein CapA/YwtB (metallophosphatase superfamily)